MKNYQNEEYARDGYIPHIDGIRAIAVLGVVAFHYFPTIVPGGYIGVDIFFVISGYLISGIILKDIYKNKFSLFNFYLRRVCRIFPPLLLIISFSLLVGYFVLHDTEYMRLCKHILASSLFLNNYLLNQESGYFDVASDSKPLLHLWSLSIEEQFYFIWPLLLMLNYRIFSGNMRLILFLTGLSFFYSIWIMNSKDSIGFYGTHVRAWEFMIGALGYIHKNKLEKIFKKFHIVGIFIIFYGLFFYDSKLNYPGYFALLPVIGALLLIINSDYSNFKSVLVNKITIYIGRISYSLYLWHWPILCLAFLIFGEDIGGEFKITLFILCFAMAMFTKKYVEDNFRYNYILERKVIFCLFFMIFLAYIAYYVRENNGLPGRGFHYRNIALGSGNVAEVDKLISKNCVSINTHHCLYLKGEKFVEYVVLGDSKGEAFFRGISQQVKESAGWMYIGGNASNGAPIPNVGLGGINSRYTKSFDDAVYAIDKLGTVKTIVVVVALRSIFDLSSDISVAGLQDIEYEKYKLIKQDFELGLQKLLERNYRVYVVYDNPTFLHPEMCTTRFTDISWIDYYLPSVPDGCRINLNDHFNATQNYRELVLSIFQELRLKYPKINIFDPTEILCEIKENLCLMTQGNRYLYGHTDHLSDYGAYLVSDAFLKFMKTAN